MNTLKRIKICNCSLGFVMLLILASAIQLEATSGQFVGSVWLHIVLGILLIALSVYHIYLHYRRSNWFARFAKNRNTVTGILWWVFLFSAITGIAAIVSWLINGNCHSHLGAVHGKIGFLMALLAIIHAARHKKSKKHVVAHQK